MFPVMMSCLDSPLPREVLEGVLRCSETFSVRPRDLFKVLEDRQAKRAAVAASASGGPTPAANPPPEMDHSMRQLFRRLASDGMTTGVEEKLLLVRENLVKQAANCAAFGGGSSNVIDEEIGSGNVGVVDLQMTSPGIVRMDHLCREFNMPYKLHNYGLLSRIVNNYNFFPAPTANQSQSVITEHRGSSTSILASTNEEWHHMFGGGGGNSEGLTVGGAKFTIGGGSDSPARSPAFSRRSVEIATEARASPDETADRKHYGDDTHLGKCIFSCFEFCRR